MKAITIALAIAIAQPVFAECDYNRQIHVLALNMYHEARGEGEKGMQMVGEVTLNRVDHPAFPDNICDVVYQRGQFSWTRKGDTTPYEKKMWERSLEIAEKLVRKEALLYNTGATHFMSRKIKNPPAWARTFERVAVVGNHVFYEMPNG
jgi:spore germination cell wall hydrolase CwlJ-like protein